MREVDYSISSGSKLEYALTEAGSKTRLYGWLSIPSIGEEPNELDTTSLDNTEFETAKYGLKPAVKLAIEFNMEEPKVASNIKEVYDLAEGKLTQFWTITRANGIVHTFKSKVQYGYNEVSADEIDKFTMFLAPIGEVKTTMPTVSA